MQSVEIQGLDKVVKALEGMPAVIREARGEVFEEMGDELLEDVQRRIGKGRQTRHAHVADVQDYYVGTGKGYVAVRAKAKTDIDGYAAGYITNALEGGHANRTSRERSAKGNRVPGKYMYRDSQTDANRLAETAARRIEDAAVKALEGDTT